ncbi:hypothetical protein [Roseibium sp. Sym1]|uniref:hypothetical protein n=1 Tax=Roseibium sp. Sym1 TaxID=3016006 RepID=UPI0022B318E4|nr:hypothetical protein [Roseibium sp. Sym1]
MTRPFIVDVGEPAFESIKHMLKGSGLAPYVSFLPRTRDIDPPELIPAPAPKFPD